MKDPRAEHDTSEELPIRRPWDNSGLRHRVEGRVIEGIDVRSLQSSVVDRSAEPARRRRPLRAAPDAGASPEVEVVHDLDGQLS